MPPPSAVPVVPSGGRGSRRDPGARARIAQSAGVMQRARDRTGTQGIVYRTGAERRVSILTQCRITERRSAARRIMDGKRTVAAETGSPSRSRYAGPRSDGSGTEVPGPAAAKMHATAPHATEMRASTSHPATEMTAAEVTTTKMTATTKVTATPEMRSAAAAATASTTSRGRIGRTRNRDRKNDNSQEIEL
jgi:hypothetical protein